MLLLKHIFLTAILVETILVIHSVTTSDVKTGVKFYLWTKSNPDDHETIIFDDGYTNQDLDASAFNASASTKIFIHGYLNSGLRRYVLDMKDAFLQTYENVNVLAVDWGPRALGVSQLIYRNAVDKIQPVGEHLANLMQFIVDNTNGSSTFDSFHVIGHSLGAHVAGCAGSKLNGDVARITGLDPAKPKMVDKSDDKKLDVSDAKLVDIIHTCGGVVAISEPIGHIDFYPNGGVSTQPGCRWLGPCSHRRAYVYFTETIVSPMGFPSKKCSSWSLFENDSCQSSEESFMGNPSENFTGGSYFLETNSEPPYGKESTRAGPLRGFSLTRIWNNLTS